MPDFRVRPTPEGIIHISLYHDAQICDLKAAGSVKIFSDRRSAGVLNLRPRLILSEKEIPLSSPSSIALLNATSP
jgi:hypothetical protein